jgi:hypothetical protein
VEVDHAAPLVLADLRELHRRHPLQVRRADRQEPRQRTVEGDGEPPPQLRGVPLPDHVRGVVVALGAQRLTGVLVSGLMGGAAPGGFAVRAQGLLSAWPAPTRPVLHDCVDGAEAGCGGGGEHHRMRTDRFRHALAASGPGTDQMPGVGGIHPRTRRAAGGAAVAAGDPGHPAQLGVRAVGADQLTRSPHSRFGWSR